MNEAPFSPERAKHQHPISHLGEIKGMWFKSMIPFLPDSRLSSPFAVFSSADAVAPFNGSQDYPMELSFVACTNGT
jgi:hypothetical protein